MDWHAAIERNREALRRILAALVAMAGLGAPTSPLRGFDGRSSDRASGSIVDREGRGDCEAIGVPGNVREASGGGGCVPPNTLTWPSDDDRPPFKGEVNPRPALPRHLHRAVLRLLRPAEAAARRLVIVAAREFAETATPQARMEEIATPLARMGGNPPPRLRRRVPKPTLLCKPGGTGIFVRPGVVLPLTPPHEEEGGAGASESPSPLWGGVRGGGTRSRPIPFQLTDPLRRPFRRRQPVPSAVPRISAPGFSEPDRSRDRRPPMPDDPVDATRLGLRLAALGRALDDLPAQARRFTRWLAREKSARESGRVRRVAPLRGGRPPGSRRRPTHEVHHVLADLHSFAFLALQPRPDTS